MVSLVVPPARYRQLITAECAVGILKFRSGIQMYDNDGRVYSTLQRETVIKRELTEKQCNARCGMERTQYTKHKRGEHNETAHDRISEQMEQKW